MLGFGPISGAAIAAIAAIGGIGGFVILAVVATVGRIVSAEDRAATWSVTLEYTDTLSAPDTSPVDVSEQQSRT